MLKCTKSEKFTYVKRLGAGFEILSIIKRVCKAVGDRKNRARFFGQKKCLAI